MELRHSSYVIYYGIPNRYNNYLDILSKIYLEVQLKMGTYYNSYFGAFFYSSVFVSFLIMCP